MNEIPMCTEIDAWIKNIIATSSAGFELELNDKRVKIPAAHHEERL